jgi:hypothetical protein
LRISWAEETCGDIITYFKVTCSITGHQSSLIETQFAYEYYSALLGNDETKQQALFDILQEYQACYGVLLNVAVFPKLDLEPICVDFSEQKPGASLPNPYQSGEVVFETPSDPDNPRENLITNLDGSGKGQLYLFQEMTVFFPTTSKVQAEVFSALPSEVTMEAYSGDQLVGSQRTGPNTNQSYTLSIEGDAIDRVIFRAPDEHSSLAEFCYFTEQAISLNDYPHIIDFEPEKRELYQTATMEGEVLTGSNSQVKTDKSFTHTHTSETSLSMTASLRMGAGSDKEGTSGSVSGSASHSWGDKDEERWDIQADASRERREKNATTTNISQMYNLLTGYHVGTNRATWVMFPRPHTLPPTDHRTFIQGIQEIEGVQEWFLVVARPNTQQELCIEVSLETGHFPEEAQPPEPDVEYDESYEDFLVTAQSQSGNALDIEKAPSSLYKIGDGWVIDRRGINPNTGLPYRKDLQMGDRYHPGIIELEKLGVDHFNESSGNVDHLPPVEDDRLANYNYQPISDSAVMVTGTISQGELFFRRGYRVLTRSQQSKPNNEQPSVPITYLTIVSRRLCACFQSGSPCPQIVDLGEQGEDPGSIVHEQQLELSPALLARTTSAQPLPITGNSIQYQDPNTLGGYRQLGINATTLVQQEPFFSSMPAMKSLLKLVRHTMASSWRQPNRYPIGTVSFLQSDYFKSRIRQLLPPEVLQQSLANVPDLPIEVIQAFPEQASVAQALELDLPSFARRTGLSIGDAARARQTLLTSFNLV